MNPEPGICTVNTCDVPTQEYLCHHCTQELQEAWDQIPPLIPVLEDISRGHDVAFYQPTAEGRGSTTGSRPPMNLNAYQLALNLRQALIYTPAEYATHSDGWRAHTQILEWVHHADLMVNGEPEDAESKANIARYKLRDIQPMPVKQLIPWLKDKAGIELTRKQIQRWHERGFIRRHNTTGHPTYHPKEILQAHAQRQNI
ncbi:hypothetical protein [uncultured Stenotrophomonas sp.]|uniref:hypothetical protein n=1 Tax=uncultured Stenotrophomonas sp. TaxID=165438 RepID=UPI0025E3B26D|nr:hypothetical protein [uncultured Stenotrophomonas sp.]